MHNIHIEYNKYTIESMNRFFIILEIDFPELFLEIFLHL